MLIGFSGTKDGLTEKQLESLEKVITKIDAKYNYNELHHGDNFGADECIHVLITEKNILNKIVIHPLVGSHNRAYSDLKNKSDISIEILNEKEYNERNKNIIENIQLLIVCPKEHEETNKSGTWASYRSAKKLNKRIIIIYPDGRKETWPNSGLIKRIKRKFKNDQDKTQNKS